MSDADWHWTGTDWLRNEREQHLLKIKEAANRFIEAYNTNNCWIENADENVSIALNDLAVAIRAMPEETEDE